MWEQYYVLHSVKEEYSMSRSERTDACGLWLRIDCPESHHDTGEEP